MKTGIVLVVVDGEEDAIIWELWKRDECPSAVAAAFILNTLRFGEVIKHMSTTSIFEHSARFYWIAETYLPQEVNISTLETICDWDVNGTWDRPFTSHPKKLRGELVMMGTDAWKPYYVLGVISDSHLVLG